MPSILRVQASRAWHGRTWRYATLVGFVVVALSFAQSCLMFWGHDAAELPSAAVGWVGDEETMRTPLMGLYRTILMPILASSVFSDSLCLDIRDHVAACVSSRTSVRRYVCSTAVIAFVGAVLVVLVPLVASQALALVAFPLSGGGFGFLTYANESSSLVDQYSSLSSDGLLVGMLLNDRYLYNLVYILYDSLWAGLLALSSVAVSLYSHRSRLLVLELPALVLLVSSALVPMGWNLCNYLAPAPLMIVRYLSPGYFVLAPVVFLVAALAAIRHALGPSRDVLL